MKKGQTVKDKITGATGKVIATQDKGKMGLIEGLPLSPDYPADKQHPTATWRNDFELQR